MKIDAFASMPHLVEHLAPIWRALPDSLRGTFQSAGVGGYRAGALGIQLGQLRRERGSEAPLTLVASYMDEQYVRPRPVVLVEHGAGQSYGHDPGAAQHPSYSGGMGRERVVLFICPSERVAQRWRDMYPETPTAVVGCPFLDPWHQQPGGAPLRSLAGLRGEHLPLVVFTFHWDCPVVPETKSAFAHYQHELVRLAKLPDEERGWRMAGHAHPRAPEIFGFWRKWGVPTFERFAGVLDYANCLVFDNTSVGFEFASTDRPVVVLNAPWYRRDVHHGGRFWEWADVGVQCDLPEDVAPMVEDALADYPKVAGRRRRVVSEVYAYTDGHATERAVKAIIECYERGDWQNWRETRDEHNPFAPA